MWLNNKEIKSKSEKRKMARGAWVEDYLPIVAMATLELIYAIVILLSRVALVNGLSPRIFVFYRQACATLVTSPIAYLSREQTSNVRMNFKIFLLIFVTAFIGVALFQNLYIEGLYLSSSSVTSAMFNLVPVITFLMATILRMEQMNPKKLTHIAKMLGTLLCVGGAIAMTLLRGQKLLNGNSQALLLATQQNWLLGCLLLLASVFCWSSWIILQVPITKRYSDHLSLSAWMCFFGTIQTGIMAFFIERDPKAWALTSILEVTACLFSGIFGTGAQYFIQSWCISRKGPLFSATFTPLSTVLTTFFATLFFHEEFYVGTLLDAITVIIGLYVFLWGKAGELKEQKELQQTSIAIRDNSFIDMEHPLLDNSHDHAIIGK